MDPLCYLRFTFCLHHNVMYVPCSLVITYWERADLLALSFVRYFLVFLSLFHMVSQVRYGT